MAILHTAVVLILVLTALIFFHELGHFLAAKLFRMKVEEFGFGLPIPPTKRLCRFAYDGETEYTIWPVLFGGFVRIAGMELDNPTATNVEREAESVHTTNIGTELQETTDVAGAVADGFNSRPLYQRFAVIFAGPLFSFLLGWIAFCLIGLTTGVADKTRLLVHEDPARNTIAYAAGLRAGDAITAINGLPSDSDMVLTTIRTSAGKKITLTIKSESGQTRDVTVTPKAEKLPGDDKPVGRLGFVPDEEPLTYRRLPLGESLAWGTRLTGVWFSTIAQLVRTHEIASQVGGPIAIARATHSAAQKGGSDTLLLLGQLSLSLGVFNLLPIPILDGGHLLLMLVEAVRRRKLTAQQQGWVITTGFAILASLFVLIMFKDISGFFRRS